jgi:hypothetical protein
MPITPITPPNTAGWTVLTDPNPTSAWTPSLSNGVDYVLTGTGTWERTKRLTVSGGRNVFIEDLAIDITVAGGPILDIKAGNVAREVFVQDTLLTNTGGYETDGVRGTSGAGGNIATGSGGTTLKMLRCRVEKLVGSNPGVHADGIQLPGGMRAIWLQDCTFQSGYVPLQLQRELFVNGEARTITALTRSGTTGTVTVTSGLDIAVGDWVEIVGASPTSWRSAWQVLSLVTGTAPSVTKFTVFLGDGGQGAWTGGGTAQKSEFVNYVGNVSMLRVNLKRFDNLTEDPPQTLTGMRINAGRPDTKGSNAEDRTPALVDGMPGTLTLEDVYCELNAGETLADMLEPSDEAAVYSLAKGELNTAATPDEFSWPNHPNISGVVKAGLPPGGDYAPFGLSLVVADAAHAHTADNVLLTQVHSLVVSDAAHSSTADNVVLVPGGDATLVVSDATHAHTADNVVLTQDHTLEVQNASHEHTADNVVLDQQTRTRPINPGKKRDTRPLWMRRGHYANP